MEKILKYGGCLYQVQGDGRTVWVNGPDGTNLARFGRYIEVRICSVCPRFRTDTTNTASDWPVFISKVKAIYGIEVPDEFRPVRFTNSP